MTIFIRSAYNYDTDRVSDETGLKCEDESKAIQSEKEEADINTIVRRFGITGHIPENIRMPQYGDFTGITDYQTALNAVRQADESFNELPAEIRKRFENDPEQFIEFALNPDNGKELVELGLAVKRTAEPTPAEPEAVKP